MCNFLSAIVLPDGEVDCRPEATNSHEHLIAARGLADNGRGEFVRVEYTPLDGTWDKLESYEFVIDDDKPPDWFTPEMRERTRATLADRVRRMIVNDERKILLGGCWILTKGARVGRAINARIFAMYSGTLGQMDGGTLEQMRGGTLEQMDGGTLEQMDGGTLVHDMRAKKK